MGEVGVELADDGVVVHARPFEAGAVGVAEAVLARAVQHVHPRPRRGHALGERAGAVGGGIVDDEQVEAGASRSNASTSRCRVGASL